MRVAGVRKKGGTKNKNRMFSHIEEVFKRRTKRTHKRGGVFAFVVECVDSYDLEEGIEELNAIVELEGWHTNRERAWLWDEVNDRSCQERERIVMGE
jgi:hypothetical protein